jgi:hypothetical protein
LQRGAVVVDLHHVAVLRDRVVLPELVLHTDPGCASQSATEA